MEIYDKSLIDELVDYSKDLSFRHKVNRVHFKCIKSGRIGLADKIAEKYRRCLPKSDMAIAFAWSLLASKKTPSND